MKSMLHAKVERQNKHRQRKRSGKPTDELIRDSERVRERTRALSQKLRLTRRDTTNTDRQKGPKS